MKEGDKCHYTDEYNKQDGIIKSIKPNIIFVVYNCDNDWKNYHNYTAVATNPNSLKPGWISEQTCDHIFVYSKSKYSSMDEMYCQDCGIKNK